MNTESFELAAWVADRGNGASETALDWIEQVAGRDGRDVVGVFNRAGDKHKPAGESFIRRFSALRFVHTGQPSRPRKNGWVIAHELPVVTFWPEPETLELAMKIAGKSPIVAVEWPDQNLLGWASMAAAIDLAKSTTIPVLSSDARAVLRDLVAPNYSQATTNRPSPESLERAAAYVLSGQIDGDIAMWYSIRMGMGLEYSQAVRATVRALPGHRELTEPGLERMRVAR